MMVAIAFFALGIIAGPVLFQILNNAEKSAKKKTRRKPE